MILLGRAIVDGGAGGGKLIESVSVSSPFEAEDDWSTRWDSIPKKCHARQHVRSAQFRSLTAAAAKGGTIVRLLLLPHTGIAFSMISDVQLAVFCNVLGVFLFLLVVTFHYINANMGRYRSSLLVDIEGYGLPPSVHISYSRIPYAQTSLWDVYTCGYSLFSMICGDRAVALTPSSACRWSRGCQTFVLGRQRHRHTTSSIGCGGAVRECPLVLFQQPLPLKP
uniref:Uncharacterized protein n=1 Tax=Anopheles farauti TaxID=69004 RepID=A0A182Q326_9DIPT